jgi:ribosomal 30S subunit maturation factor RimM
MNKKVFMLALVSFLCLGLAASSSYASGKVKRSGFMIFNSSDLIGAPVNDSHGRLMGVVDEVMVDSGGHAFAVVNHGDYDLYGDAGVDNPIPFEKLQISKTKAAQETIVLKTDMEHLDFAPSLNPLKKETRQDEAGIYEYYGIQPYWTRSGATGTMGKGEFTVFSSLDLVGTAVKNSSSKVIGIVNGVMVDSEGRAFAVVNHGDYDLYGDGGVNTPVPLQELQISQTKGGRNVAFLKTDVEHLDFAPYLSPVKKFDRQREANIYEYYGIQLPKKG